MSYEDKLLVVQTSRIPWDECVAAYKVWKRCGSRKKAAAELGMSYDKVVTRTRIYQRRMGLRVARRGTPITDEAAAEVWHKVMELGSIVGAARALGIGRKTAQRRMNHYRDVNGIPCDQLPEEYWIAREDRRDAFAVKVWAAWLREGSLHVACDSLGISRRTGWTYTREHRLNKGWGPKRYPPGVALNGVPVEPVTDQEAREAARVVAGLTGRLSEFAALLVACQELDCELDHLERLLELADHLDEKP